MSQTGTSQRPESGADTQEDAAGRGRRYVSKAAPYLRRGVESGALPSIVGGTSVLSGFRALRRGELGRAIGRFAFGGAVLAAAITQRRSRSRGEQSDVEASDVAGTGSDLDAVADEAGGVGEEDHATGEEASAVVDTAPDLEDARSAEESESDADSGSVDQRDVVDTGVGVDDPEETDEQEREQDAGGAAESETETEADAQADAETEVDTDTESEGIDRLGQAAFDRQSQEVPAPQQAFNRGFLAHSTEATWGIRESDDAVLVSQDYDAIQGRDGVKYVASSEIGADERELPIPNAVRNHWNDVLGRGATAVGGGDNVLFVTTDDLAADHLLRVLPAEWADDELGEEE